MSSSLDFGTAVWRHETPNTPPKIRCLPDGIDAPRCRARAVFATPTMQAALSRVSRRCHRHVIPGTSAVKHRRSDADRPTSSASGSADWLLVDRVAERRDRGDARRRGLITITAGPERPAAVRASPRGRSNRSGAAQLRISQRRSPCSRRLPIHVHPSRTIGRHTARKKKQAKTLNLRNPRESPQVPCPWMVAIRRTPSLLRFQHPNMRPREWSSREPRRETNRRSR